jgi:SAM-dependent methyltransferase
MRFQTTFYTDSFFESRSEGSLNSAKEIVPVILKMLPGIKSVVDVGCGTGTWLKIFKESGIQDVLGLDGNYVNRERLVISQAEFGPTDLSVSFTIPHQFDLLISLEVAEHLPPAFAEEFVKILTQASNQIVFSAAVPNQGGTNHINEQLPSYWIRLFSKLGFKCYDVLRPILWNNSKIAIEYKQNTFLFLKEGSNVPLLKDLHLNNYQYDAIHPDLLAHHLTLNKNQIDFIMQGRLGIKDSFRILKRAVLNKIKWGK